MKLTTSLGSKFQPQKILVYGDPGTGKTELIGRLAEKYNLIWFDLDRGYTTLSKLPPEWQERVNLISLPDMHQYPVALSTMLKVLLFRDTPICDAHGQVMCQECSKKPEAHIETVNLSKLSKETIVVVDNMTQLSVSTTAQLMKGKPDTYKFEFDEWRLLGAWLSQVLSAIQQAPCHIICTAHLTEDDPDSALRKWVPKFGTREFSAKSGGPFDHIIFMETQGKNYKAYSSRAGKPNTLCRSRTDFRIELMETPSLLPLFEGPEVIRELNAIAAAAAKAQTPAAKTPAPVNGMAAKLAAVRAANATVTK